MGQIYDGVGRLRTWGLGLGSVKGVGRSWVGELGLWWRGSREWVDES